MDNAVNRWFSTSTASSGRVVPTLPPGVIRGGIGAFSTLRKANSCGLIRNTSRSLASRRPYADSVLHT